MFYFVFPVWNIQAEFMYGKKMEVACLSQLIIASLLSGPLVASPFPSHGL